MVLITITVVMDIGGENTGIRNLIWRMLSLLPSVRYVAQFIVRTRLENSLSVPHYTNSKYSRDKCQKSDLENALRATDLA